MKTKTINVADLLSHAERYAISKIISEIPFIILLTNPFMHEFVQLSFIALNV